MNGLFYGICLLFVIGSAQAVCDQEKILDCTNTYTNSLKAGMDKAKICVLSNTMVNCLESAASGCGDHVKSVLENARKEFEKLGCSGSNVPKLYAHSSVISGAFLAAVALKKLLL